MIQVLKHTCKAAHTYHAAGGRPKGVPQKLFLLHYRQHGTSKHTSYPCKGRIYCVTSSTVAMEENKDKFDL